MEQRVAEPEGIPPGQSVEVTVEGKEVALFNVDGTYYAVGGRCPHRSGPLAKGRVETVEGKPAVRCPLHGWLFELETGRCLTRPGAGVPSYPARCREEGLFLGFPQGESSGPALSGQIG